MINNIFNIYDKANIQSNTENNNITYDMQSFDNFLDKMIQKKENNIILYSDEIEIK